MNPEPYYDCQFHYAPQTGAFAVIKRGQLIPFASIPEQTEALSTFLDYKRKERVVLRQHVRFGHFLFSGHAGHVQVYEWESIWTVTMPGRLPVPVNEIEMHPELVPAFDSMVVNSETAGNNYRVTVGGDQTRQLVLHVRARSAKRAIQFAYAYARCRWLNNKHTPADARDMRRVWITSCTLYLKAKS